MTAEPMSPLVAGLLGIVEGLTEYLPVSSTGHLILVGHFLKLPEDAGTKAFDIVIQLGAIFAVVVHYRKLLAGHVGGLVRRDAASVRLLTALVIAFVPLAVLGLVFGKKIQDALFGSFPVAIALIVGGIVMIAVEISRTLKARGQNAEQLGLVGLEHVTPKRALTIGLAQCLSLFPGTSRSMSTIVAGQLTGLSTATAAEFTFLLGLPTLGAATLYSMLKHRHDLATVGMANVAIGLVVSFFVAWAVIAVFLAYLKRRGLAPFGVYRIVIGVVVLLFALT